MLDNWQTLGKNAAGAPESGETAERTWRISSYRSLTPCGSTKRSLAAVPPGTRHGGQRASFWCSRNPWCDAATFTRSIGRGGRTALRRASSWTQCVSSPGWAGARRQKTSKAGRQPGTSIRSCSRGSANAVRQKPSADGTDARVMASVAERKALNSSSQAGAPARVTARVAPCVAAGVFQ